jgi:hypothetical protein
MLVSVVLAAVRPAYMCRAGSRGIFNTSRRVKGCQRIANRGSGLVSISAFVTLRGQAWDNGPMAKKRPRDLNELAWQIVQEATGNAVPEAEEPDTRNPAAVALSKLGASKGGHARAAALSPAKRRAIAKKAVAARWKTHTK